MIDSIASRGDGLATTEDGRKLYIPYAAPGDAVIVAVGRSRGDGFEARIQEFKNPGARRQPICEHFTHCGGCSVQHLIDGDYRSWKRNILVTALAQRGLGGSVDDLVIVPTASRRRVTFNVFMGSDGPILGFMERRDRQVTSITDCPLLVPALNRLLTPLRALLADILVPGERARVAVAQVGNSDGAALDLVFEWDGSPGLADRERLAAFAEDQGLARLSLRDRDGFVEPVAGRAPVTARFGSADLALPPGGFMQPTSEGEAELVAAIYERIMDADRIIELFAGAGTFTLAMAEKAHVHAIDGNQTLISALTTAAGRAGLGGRITTDVRDLADRPLLAAELVDADTVILDPPRAGALRQVEQIAMAGNIRRVIMVSCNPATFARDARFLVDGGFAMGAVLPIDQFLYSHHLECVAAFERSGA